MTLLSMWAILSADEDLFGQCFAIKDSPFFFLAIKPFDGNAFVDF